MKSIGLFSLYLALLPLSLRSQDRSPTPPTTEDYVRAHYTKYEYRVPMRDGCKLFTSVYVPKDSAKAYPTLMDRTPYSVAPYGEDQYKTRLGPSDEFEKAGYIFVYQDVRGRYLSEGQFFEMHCTSTIRTGRRMSTIAPIRMTPSSSF